MSTAPREQRRIQMDLRSGQGSRNRKTHGTMTKKRQRRMTSRPTFATEKSWKQNQIEHCLQSPCYSCEKKTEKASHAAITSTPSTRHRRSFSMTVTHRDSVDESENVKRPASDRAPPHSTPRAEHPRRDSSNYTFNESDCQPRQRRRISATWKWTWREERHWGV